MVKSEFGINYSTLPKNMQEGARLYVEHGIEGGSFLTAVFSNNFLEAFHAADPINTKRMEDWALFLYNDVPWNCKGSPEAVREWISVGGLMGLRKQEAN